MWVTCHRVGKSLYQSGHWTAAGRSYWK